MGVKRLSAPLLPNSGFTIVEVVFALAIMTLAFASILAIESGSINATTRAKQMNIVGMLAKNQMVETEFAIQGKTFDEIPKEKSGTFESPYQDYRWQTKIKELSIPNFMGMAGGSSGEGKETTGGGSAPGGDMINQVISSNLSKAIRQVSVTVFWKQGAKEKSFALSTFWVNLNHEISLTGQ